MLLARARTTCHPCHTSPVPESPDQRRPWITVVQRLRYAPHQIVTSRNRRERMPSRVIGEQAKPRALLFGLDGAMAERVGALFAHWRTIKDFEDVEQREWDVLVTARSAVFAEHHLYVISVGCDTYLSRIHGQVHPALGSFHNPSESDNAFQGWIRWTGNSRAREFVIPENLSPSTAHLIETQLAPLAQREEVHQWLETSVTSPEYDQAWKNALGAALLDGR